MTEPLFTAGLALLAILGIVVVWLLGRSRRAQLETLKGERDRLLARFSDSERRRRSPSISMIFTFTAWPCATTSRGFST